jgi:5-methylcytosine-specific restriction endonuclease McrA
MATATSARSRGRAASATRRRVHHLVPSSQAPHLFWEPGNFATVCTKCNYEGGTKVAQQNAWARIAELERIVLEHDQRIAQLMEMLACLEQPKSAPATLAHPAIY